MKDCRSFIGFLTTRLLTTEERKQMEELGFRVRDVPTVQGRTTVYPYRKLLGSLGFMVAAVVVYSSIGKQIQCVKGEARQEDGGNSVAWTKSPFVQGKLGRVA